MVQYSLDTDRLLIAQLLKGMKQYELVHVMTNSILNKTNWTQTASGTRDTGRDWL